MSQSLQQRTSRVGGRKMFDAVTLLSVYFVALFAIESRLVIRPLGGVGQPAEIVSLLGLGWWMFFQVQRTRRTTAGPQPVRIALVVVVAAFLASYVAATVRAISGTEYSLANIGVVVLLGWVGATLLANDGIPSMERFDVCIRRLVLAGALLGLLGIVQFVAKSTLIDSISLPGLSANVQSGTILARAGFARPSGTALHPIEFGAVLTMILPMAIVRARASVHGPIRAWSPTVLITVAALLSGSRSALLCTGVVIVVLAAAWSARERWMTAGAVVVMLGVVSVAIPQMLGTLLHLFTRIDDDPSVSSRTGSYDLVVQLIRESPFVGRGFRTMTIDYRILDNQYLGLIIEVGVIGFLSFVGLLVTGMVCAQLARRRSTDPMIRDYGQALTAALVAGALGLALYDGLSFPMASSVLFLFLGLAGGLLRLASTRERPVPKQRGTTATEAVAERRSAVS